MFSLSPAEVLIDNLAYANENPDLSAIELFERFVNEDKIYIKGKAMSVCDFFDTLIDTFKQVFLKVSESESIILAKFWNEFVLPKDLFLS